VQVQSFVHQQPAEYSFLGLQRETPAYWIVHD